jgi:hypothetical protein
MEKTIDQLQAENTELRSQLASKNSQLETAEEIIHELNKRLDNSVQALPTVEHDGITYEIQAASFRHPKNREQIVTPKDLQQDSALVATLVKMKAGYLVAKN